MANYPFTDAFRNEFKGAVSAMTERRINLMEQDFPLSPGQIIKACVHPEVRAAAQVLMNHSADCIHYTNVLYAVLPRAAGVERDTLLHMQVPRTVYQYGQQQYQHGARELLHAGRFDRVPLDLGTLEPEARASLVKWTQGALLERRRAAGIKTITDEFINDHCNSTGELLARWPGLAIVFTKMPGKWPNRLRDRPRTLLNRWHWPRSGKSHTWLVDNAHKMEGCEIVLSAAAMMQGQSTPPRASVDQWRKLA